MTISSDLDREGQHLACSIVNDVVQYFKSQNSYVYICALDVEKCFDSICHISLFYQLIDVLQVNHWILLYRWYINLQGGHNIRYFCSYLIFS